MGIILGALGGAGEALQSAGSTMLKADIDTQARQQESDLSLQRGQALEQFKLDATAAAANQQRDASAQRISAARQGIVNNQIDTKYAQTDSAIAQAQGGASPEDSAAPGNDTVQAALTPDQLAVIQQSKDADRKKLMGDRSTYVDAAIQTGDIAPKDVMASSTKEEVMGIRAQAMQAVQEAKNDAWREKIDFLTKKSSDDNNTRMLIAAMRSTGGGKDGEEPAKVRAANIYLDSVNKDRAAANLPKITFEEAYSAANFATKPDQDSSIRARVATNLMNNDSKLAKDPVALRSAVDSAMSAINADAPAPAPAPKPGASGAPPAGPTAKVLSFDPKTGTFH